MKIILASGSPRRKELLNWAGIQFEIKVSDVDETPKKKETPAKMVQRLSLEKAIAVGNSLVGHADTTIVIAADTTVVSPKGKILGKPTNEKDALKMLSEIQGKTHQVLTGYSLVQVSRGKVIKKISKIVKTQVTMRKLSKDELKYYLSRGESMDKAGAYAAQGYGMVLIEKISGSYTNVVGLPMKEVIEDLQKLHQSDLSKSLS
jgi:septum formation protein